ncbi:integrase core domain-containing protein [Ruegeria sp. AU67]|uniref:integrase core domain-containing protein n=1 Tax=Ruegeria sp. AU67 TaxID=2108530 RepID=UPI000D68924F
MGNRATSLSDTASGATTNKCLNEHIFGNLAEARKVIEVWRIDYNTQRLTDYPESLQAEIKAYIDRLAQRDLFSGDGPDRPLRETSLRNTQAHLRQMLDTLITTGRNPEDFTSLSVLSHQIVLKLPCRR